MQMHRRKALGAYFTPDAIATALVKWAVRSPRDRMLDPSAGDGQFLELHRRSVGVETDPSSAALARKRAPWALVHEGDFFSWAARTRERFECAAGNPPFIRYQRFTGEVRETALALCSSLGAAFSGLASSWAPFLVATASLLKPNGRLAFVVPAEIGHAPYAAPLIRFLFSNFSDVRLLAVREKVFPDLSEDVWLLYAEGYGQRSTGLVLATDNKFTYTERPPTTGRFVNEFDLARWNYRLRPFLLPKATLDLYQDLAQRPTTARLGQLAKVGIGYVTGANDFFHLRPSSARRLSIPNRFLRVAVRNGRALPKRAITTGTVTTWLSNDEPCLLLHLPPQSDLPGSVRQYLNTQEGQEAREAYKCRVRDPWYSVPDVSIPHAFLSYMSGTSPALVANRARCVGTNSVHTVHITARTSIDILQSAWEHPLAILSCELEGHPLGGGMLKIEPREAQRILLSFAVKRDVRVNQVLWNGVDILRAWRHSSAAA